MVEKGGSSGSARVALPTVSTDREVAAIRPDGTRRVYVVTGARGLRLDVRVTVVTWSLIYKTRAGRVRRHVLGRYPAVSLAAARAEARRIRGEVDLGRDPLGERLQERQIMAGATVEQLVDACLRANPYRPATLRNWRRQLVKDIAPTIGKIPASALNRHEIRAWSDAIARRSGYMANRAFELVRRAYSWAVETDRLTATPFVRIRRPAEEYPSDRVLSTDEVRALWAALDRQRTRAPSLCDAIRLLLLTGVRKSAVVGMRRSELDGIGTLEARWIIPGGRSGRSKSGRPHVVPLSPAALAVIRERLDWISGDLIFPGHKPKSAGREPPEVMAWSGRSIELLRETVQDIRGAEVPRWTVHNLRHTMATHMRESLGVSRDVVEAILGHRLPGSSVARVYDRSELLAERRAALDAWGAWVSSLA